MFGNIFVISLNYSEWMYCFTFDSLSVTKEGEENFVSIYSISCKCVRFKYKPQFIFQINVTSTYWMEAYLHNRDQMVFPNYKRSYGSVRIGEEFYHKPNKSYKHLAFYEIIKVDTKLDAPMLKQYKIYPSTDRAESNANSRVDV